MAEKNMILAMVLSVIFAGLGLIYADDIKMGAILVVIGIVANILYYFVNPIFGIFAFIAWVYGLYATYKQVKAINGA